MHKETTMQAPDERPKARSPSDPTPIVGAETDVARLTHAKPVPPHEQTAEDDRDVADWDRVAAMDDFKKLMKAKRRFVIPATVFFVVYYFSLPVLVGYAPQMMSKSVIGTLNIAYLFALSQFFMAWIVAWLYVRAAARFDRIERDIVSRVTPSIPERGK